MTANDSTRLAAGSRRQADRRSSSTMRQTLNDSSIPTRAAMSLAHSTRGPVLPALFRLKGFWPLATKFVGNGEGTAPRRFAQIGVRRSVSGRRSAPPVRMTTGLPEAAQVRQHGEFLDGVNKFGVCQRR